MAQEGKALEWDDSIKNDNQFSILPEGDYPFVIDHYERALHNGSEKIPPCKKAIVYFNITDPEGTQIQIREQYILWTTLEWKLSELFRGVGLKKEGEELKMDWNKLPGCTGRCHVVLEPDKNEPSKKYNHISKLYPADKPGFTAGKF